MTSETRSTYLRHLDSNEGDGPKDRAMLVEHLRASAARLRDTAALNSFGSALGAQVTGSETNIHHAYAAELLTLAQRLCDHVRVCDSRCRYCEAILPGYPYGSSVFE